MAVAMMVCVRHCGSGTASEEVAAPLKHPCLICLDNEGDTGHCSMCHSGGQTFRMV